MARVAPRSIISSPPKCGKTTACAAIAHAGVSIAPAGAMVPMREFLGVPPEEGEVLDGHTISSMLDSGEKVLARKAPPPVIYLDDVTLAFKREFGQAQINWRVLDKNIVRLLQLAEASALAGVIFLASFHEQPARVSSGKAIRGGPQLPGQAPETVSAGVDIVLRVVSDETMHPWPFVVWSRPRRDWVAGDRLGVFPDNGPLNIAEGLRARGWDIPYPRCAPWMGKAVEQWSSAILAGDMGAWRDTLRPLVARASSSGKCDPRHLRWAAQDALHRAIIVRRRDDPLSWLGEEPGTGASDAITETMT